MGVGTMRNPSRIDEGKLKKYMSSMDVDDLYEDDDYEDDRPLTTIKPGTTGGFGFITNNTNSTINVNLRFYGFDGGEGPYFIRLEPGNSSPLFTITSEELNRYINDGGKVSQQQNKYGIVQVCEFEIDSPIDDTDTYIPGVDKVSEGTLHGDNPSLATISNVVYYLRQLETELPLILSKVDEPHNKNEIGEFWNDCKIIKEVLISISKEQNESYDLMEGKDAANNDYHLLLTQHGFQHLMSDNDKHIYKRDMASGHDYHHIVVTGTKNKVNHWIHNFPKGQGYGGGSGNLQSSSDLKRNNELDPYTSLKDQVDYYFGKTPQERTKDTRRDKSTIKI